MLKRKTDLFEKAFVAFMRARENNYKIHVKFARRITTIEGYSDYSSTFGGYFAFASHFPCTHTKLGFVLVFYVRY